jgi:hypothetical protein
MSKAQQCHTVQCATVLTIFNPDGVGKSTIREKIVKNRPGILAICTLKEMLLSTGHTLPPKPWGRLKDHSA